MAYADSALRVVVSGIRKGPVKRYDKGIAEEDNLGYFFYDRGCMVESVRLVIDSKRGDASRGFGFVDFEDQESFQRALDLNGTRAPDIAGKDGCLHIEAARPATEETRNKQQALLHARHATEEMERELRFREARVTELMREVQRKRERQNVWCPQGGQRASPAPLAERLDLHTQLEEENRRQDAIRKAQESLRAAEETLHRAMQVEEERTKAMEAIACTVDGEQTRPHHEAAHADETSSQPPAADESLAHASHHQDVTSSTEQLQVRVRNTFLEYYVPQTLSGLVRTKTAPPEFLSSGQVSPKGGDDSPNGGSTIQASSITPSPVPCDDDEGGGKRANGTITGGAERPRWASLEDDDDSPCVTAPWVLKRDKSAADVSRLLLEEKMGSQDYPRGSTSGSGAPKATPPEQASMGSGPPTDAAAAASRAAAERRHVRLRNVPVLPGTELKALLAEELTRLWRAVRGRGPPLVEEFRITEKAQPAAAKTFAQVAAHGSTEVEVVFADADDAAWLVDGRQPQAWSRAETLSLRGRMIQVEWVAPPPVDWRRLRYTADTDASSHISYGTLGTRQSFSSKIGERERPERTERTERSDGRPNEPGRSSATGPARNRTVVLDGLPTDWPIYHVREEVLTLLKKLWQRDGLKFDPREQLHQGSDGGINVRHSRNRNEENGGTCLVRLRSYLDAKWLVESTGGRLTVGGGIQLRVSWARPRQGDK